MSQKNIDFSFSDNFILTIPELPIVSELAQRVLVPNIAVNPAEVHSRFVMGPEPGEKMVFNELDIEFYMDENWDGYVEAYNWLLTMCSPGHSIPIEERRQFFCDISVQLMNNNKINTRKLTFRDCFPTGLAAIQLDNTVHQELPFILTIAYTDMKIEPKGNNLTGYTRQSNETDTANY